MIGEGDTDEVCHIRRRDNLRLRLIHQNQLECQLRQCQQLWPSEISEPLRERGPLNPIAADDAVYSHAVVEEVPGDVVCNEIDVVERVHTANFENFSTSEALPVESKIIEKVSEVGAELDR